jgi:hypothetical protein
MDLLAVKAYFQSVPQATAIEAADFFATDITNIACYIEHWVLKGCLIKQEDQGSCQQACTSCHHRTAPHFIWNDSA